MGGTRGARCPPPVPPTAASLVAAHFFSPSKRRKDSKAGGAFIPPPHAPSPPFLRRPERHFRPHFRWWRPLPGGRTARTCPTKTPDAARGGTAPLLPHSRHSAPPSPLPFPSAPSQPAPSRLQLQQGGGQLAVAAFQVLQRLEKPAELEGQQGSWGGGARGSETFGGGERAPSTALLVGTGRWGSLPLFSFLPLPSPQPRGPF